MEQRLQAHWSPESIAGRLALDYPKPPARRVSHEAIYRWSYREAQAGGQIYSRLRWQHQRRRQQRSSWELSAD